jgi:hypothetical protein
LYDIAATRPDEFFACLGQRSDQAVTATLKDLAAATGYASWHQRSVETDWKTRLANLSMDQGTSASPQVRRVAAAALRFARQRLPYEFDKDATPENEVGAPVRATGPEE